MRRTPPANRSELGAANEILAACPLCGSVDFKGWITGRDRSHRITSQTFLYSRCRACRVVFESVRPREADMPRFYPTSYYEPRRTPAAARPGSIRNRVVSGLVELNRAYTRSHPDALPERLRELYEPRSPESRLLDYGCGSPAFLHDARRKGWRTTGADVSDEVLGEVAEAGHDAVRAEPAALEAVPDRTLGLVRLNHVVEHLYHPREVIATLRRKLEPGGLIHLSTPNPDSYAARVFRSFWLGLDCPRHVLLYPARTLAMLLRELGFRTVEIHHEVITKDTTRSLGHAMHALGLIPHERILGMAEKELLDASLRAPARFVAARGASDRFHCIAAA